MTDLHWLSRNLQNATYPGHEFAQAVREVVAAIVERMEPASEGAKVECPDGCEEIKRLRAVKLAQIDVLEEASKLICKRCDSGDPFPHKKNQNPYSTAKTLCHAARIHALIAALKKELEG